MRIVSLSIAAALAAFAVPAFAQAATYVDGKCQVQVPDDWKASKTRSASPDKKLWAELLDAPTTAEIVNMELALKAVKIGEDMRTITMVSTASYGGLTNKMYHVVTKSSPACIADVVAPAGPQEALARQIASTVSLKH